jgi:hypothetical protein
MNKTLNPEFFLMAFGLVWSASASSAQGTVGNGTFQDLNFAAGTLVYNPVGQYNQIEAGPALPGWTASIGGVDQSTILYDVFSGSSASIALYDPTTPFAGGNYTLALIGGAGYTAALQQTGTIPASANSIQIVSETYPLNNPIINSSAGLIINGQPVSLLPISVQNNGLTYAGDVSQYAGKTVTIEFYVSDPTALGSLNLQDIAFSSQGVPEPGTMALACLGGLALVSVARKKRR